MWYLRILTRNRRGEVGVVVIEGQRQKPHHETDERLVGIVAVTAASSSTTAGLVITRLLAPTILAD